MHFSCILNLGNHQFNIKGWGGILISEWFSLGTQSADSIYCINEKKIEYKVLFWGQTNVLIMFFFSFDTCSAIISKHSRCFLHFLGGHLKGKDK